MKKILARLACCCVLSVATFTPVISFAQSTHSKNYMAGKECTVKMKNGKMLVMANGKWKVLTSTKAMPDGTIVAPDGTVQTKDGTKKILKDGDCVKADGTIKWK